MTDKTQVTRIFFQNLQLPDSIIFANPQLTVRNFPEIFGSEPPEVPVCVMGISWGLSPPHPHERGVPPPPKGRPRGGSIYRRGHYTGNQPRRAP